MFIKNYLVLFEDPYNSLSMTNSYSHQFATSSLILAHYALRIAQIYALSILFKHDLIYNRSTHHHRRGHLCFPLKEITSKDFFLYIICTRQWFKTNILVLQLLTVTNDRKYFSIDILYPDFIQNLLKTSSKTNNFYSNLLLFNQ